MKIYESGENYLETILMLQQKKGNVRSVDIVNELGYSKSSVSRAVNILKDAGLIGIDAETGIITFTKVGVAKAEQVLNRHKTLHEFLTKLGVEDSVAEEDACRIEHVISPETFNAILSFLKK